MKTFILTMLASVVLPMFANATVLSKKEYKSMSENDIRQVLLEHTPIGSTNKQVELFIREQLRPTVKYLGVPGNGKSAKKAYPIENGGYRWSAILANWDWWKHLFMAGYYVEARWFFDQNGVLMDIVVIKGSDGI